MLYDEYKKKLEDLESTLKVDKFNLVKQYIDESLTCKIGDTITDHCGSIIFEKLKYTIQYRTGKPTPIYFGTELKKDGTPRKDKSKRDVYGENVIQ